MGAPESFPAAPLHPVAQMALNLLRQNGSVDLLPGATQKLAQAYAQTFGTPDVVAATQDLLRVADHIRVALNAPQVAATLVLLTFCAKDELNNLHAGHLQRMSQDMAKRSEDAAARLGAEPLGLPIAPTAPQKGQARSGPMARHHLRK